MTQRKTNNKYSGRIRVCAHEVAYSYWDFRAALTPDLEARLEEEAEHRAQQCIIEGYQSGALYSYVDDGKAEEVIYGWWEILR